MNYLDTSFIAPYYLEEANSQQITVFLQNLPAGSFTISDWTQAEFASLLARRVRMGELTLSFAQTVLAAFTEDMHSSADVTEPTRADFTEATNLLLHDPSLGLRAPDALHLAIVHNRNLTLYTLDQTLLHAAQALGMPATDADIRP